MLSLEDSIGIQLEFENLDQKYSQMLKSKSEDEKGLKLQISDLEELLDIANKDSNYNKKEFEKSKGLLVSAEKTIEELQKRLAKEISYLDDRNILKAVVEDLEINEIITLKFETFLYNEGFSIAGKKRLIAFLDIFKTVENAINSEPPVVEDAIEDNEYFKMLLNKKVINKTKTGRLRFTMKAVPLMDYIKKYSLPEMLLK